MEQKIHIGSFFGKDIFIETSLDDKFDYATAFKSWVEREKFTAVENYKSEMAMLRFYVPKN